MATVGKALCANSTTPRTVMMQVPRQYHLLSARAMYVPKRGKYHTILINMLPMYCQQTAATPGLPNVDTLYKTAASRAYTRAPGTGQE